MWMLIERKAFLTPKMASEAVSDHWVSKMLSRRGLGLLIGM